MLNGHERLIIFLRCIILLPAVLHKFHHKQCMSEQCCSRLGGRQDFFQEDSNTLSPAMFPMSARINRNTTMSKENQYSENSGILCNKTAITSLLCTFWGLIVSSCIILQESSCSSITTISSLHRYKIHRQVSI